MTYLAPPEYELFGLEPSTPESWAAAASALMDAHCRRPTLAVHEYKERRRLRPGRNSVQLTFLPLAPLAPAATPFVFVRARYGVPRRGEGGPAAELAADAAQAFGLPGAWTELDPAALDFAAETGEVTLPVNALGLAFNEVEVVYTAGLESIPGALKTACAQIVRNAQATPALTVRGSSLDRMNLEYFADSLLDSDVRKLLAPYVAQKAA
jgi:hypothetical protein